MVSQFPKQIFRVPASAGLLRWQKSPTKVGTLNTCRIGTARYSLGWTSEISNPILGGTDPGLLMELTDKSLLLACRRGEQDAWDALVKRYQRLIYAIPRRAGLEDDQAAEVFQEVFTTLVQKLDDIQDPERLQAWLVTTARRKTWRLFSRNKAWRQASWEDEEGDAEEEFARIPDEAPLAEEVMLRLEEQHRLRTALAALDERCRKLLTLLFYDEEEVSYADIATTLGIKTGSIGPTRARCLQKMLTLLEG